MTDKVTMKALDTLHISNVQSEALMEGDVFHVSEADAKLLEKRGLAERGGTASKALNVSSETDRPDTREELDAERGNGKAVKFAPANKAQAAAPENKSVSADVAASSSRKAAAKKGK